MLKDGEFLFFLDDVMKLLGEYACDNIPEGEVENIEMVSFHGKKYINTLIREAALYRTIFRCTEPVGEVFLQWLTRDFYPQIRKKEADRVDDYEKNVADLKLITDKLIGTARIHAFLS